MTRIVPVGTTPQPLLSVIVLGYNGRRFLDGCLGSLANQTLPRDCYEFLYADNHSTDGSADLVERGFPEIRVLRFEENLGFAAGNNRAAEAARGRYLLLLNQDMVLHRGCLAALLEAARAAEQAGKATAAWQVNMLMPWHKEFDGPRDRLPSHAHFVEAGVWGFMEFRRVTRPHGPFAVDVVSGACFMIDRQALSRLGYLFDPWFFMYAEDLDLSLRLRAAGYHLAMVPDAVAYHLHEVHPRMRGRHLARAFRATRNRLLAYYKTTEPAVFRRLLPRLLLGAPLKVYELGGDRVRQSIQAAGMVLVSAGAAVAAFVASRRYRSERAALLAAKARGNSRSGHEPI